MLNYVNKIRKVQEKRIEADQYRRDMYRSDPNKSHSVRVEQIKKKRE